MVCLRNEARVKPGATAVSAERARAQVGAAAADLTVGGGEALVGSLDVFWGGSAPPETRILRGADQAVAAVYLANVCVADAAQRRGVAEQLVRQALAVPECVGECPVTVTLTLTLTLAALPGLASPYYPRRTAAATHCSESAELPCGNWWRDRLPRALRWRVTVLASSCDCTSTATPTAPAERASRCTGHEPKPYHRKMQARRFTCTRWQ